MLRVGAPVAIVMRQRTGTKSRCTRPARWAAHRPRPAWKKSRNFSAKREEEGDSTQSTGGDEGSVALRGAQALQQQYPLGLERAQALQQQGLRLALRPWCGRLWRCQDGQEERLESTS